MLFVAMRLNTKGRNKTLQKQIAVLQAELKTSKTQLANKNKV